MHHVEDVTRSWVEAVLVGIASFIFTSLAVADDSAITADPPVPRPKTEPCVVHLFADVRFDDFSPRDFEYQPPVDCPRPWAKVVFEGDFRVTAGLQYDRTASHFHH